MKRLLLLFVAPLLVVSCSNFYDDQQSSQMHGLNLPKLSVSFAEETRTYVEDGLYLCWHEDDVLSVFYANTLNSKYEFDGKAGDKGGDISHVSTPNGIGQALDKIYAIYPYDVDATISSSGIISFNMPATQSYNMASFGQNVNTMVAVSSDANDTFLPFKNVGGYLKIKLYGNATIQSIAVKGNNGEKIAGNATITATYGGVPKVVMADDATDTVTIDCGKGGIKLRNNSDTPTVFWVVLPPTTFEDGITVTTTDIDGKVVEKNTNRRVTINRNEIQPMTAFRVNKQSDSNIGSFSTKMIRQGYYQCTVSIAPDDKAAPYLLGLYTMEEVENFDLDDDDNLFNYHVDMIVDAGRWSGLDAESSILARTKRGAISDLKLSGLYAGSKYLLMASYYDEETFERLGDVYRYEFYAKTPQVSERDFEFDIDIESSVAQITVTPEQRVGRYYFDVMPRVVIEQEATMSGCSNEEYIQSWWAKVSGDDINGGNTVDSIYANLCSAGTDSYEFELLADTEYYVFAFEVDTEVACVSIPELQLFKTGSVAQSNLTLGLSVSDITSCGATISITASNSTDPYVAGITVKEEWDTLGTTDQERLDNILDIYNFDTPAYGNGEFKEDKNFTPDTTYVFYAFGYKGGVATTKLFYIEFTTLADNTSNINVSIKRIGYFNARDIKALDPTFKYDGVDNYGFAICPIELSVTGGEYEALYYYNWHVTPDYDRAWVTDDNRFGRMLYWEERPKYLWTVVTYGSDAWFGAVAKDADGYYSEQYLEIETITRDGVSNAQLFIDWLRAHPDAEPDPSQYIDYYAGV